MKQLYLALITAALMTGCGGGDDDSTSTEASTVPVAETPAAVEPIESTAKFEDLVIPDHFDLRTTYSLPISVDLDTTDPMSLSIYGDYTIANDGSITPIAGSRIISGQIANGDFNGNIAATGQLKSLLIEAWYSDPNKLPFQTIVSVSPDGINISN